MGKKIGVLALQGDFDKHVSMLHRLGAETVLIREPEQLQLCRGLIIPGGESTTLTKLMHLGGLYQPLRDFSQTFPVMGTCAGMIMLASQVEDDQRIRPLNLINVSVRRNVYGRQIDSFTTPIKASFLGEHAFKAIFIRAPGITKIGPDTEILMQLDAEPVMVRTKNITGLTFHPELTDDTRIHQNFLEQKI